MGYITTQFGNLSYQIFGTKSDRTFIAIHGWLDNSASFEPLSALLPEIQVISVDLPGHGHSEHHGGGSSYFFMDWVVCLRELVSLLQQSGLVTRKVNLLGHSMGAAISVLYASVYPLEVEELWLFDGLIPLTAESGATIDRIRGYVDYKINLKHHRPKKYYQSIEECIKLRSSIGGISENAARYLVRRGTDKSALGFFFLSDPRLKIPSAIRISREQALTILENVICDVKVLVASDGYKFGIENYRKLLSHKTNIQFIEIEGRHHVHLEEPEKVAKLIRDKWL